MGALALSRAVLYNRPSHKLPEMKAVTHAHQTDTRRSFMNIVLLTNEYPPNIYGGAGVHIEYLSREIARLDEKSHQLQILCFGHQAEERDNVTVKGIRTDIELSVGDPRHQSRTGRESL